MSLKTSAVRGWAYISCNTLMFIWRIRQDKTVGTSTKGGLEKEGRILSTLRTNKLLLVTKISSFRTNSWGNTPSLERKLCHSERSPKVSSGGATKHMKKMYCSGKIPYFVSCSLSANFGEKGSETQCKWKVTYLNKS